jgi:hypothetical protein
MKPSEFLQDIGRPMAYYPKLRKVTGSTTATILLCNFIYWRGKESGADGWLYKSSDEIEDETGLSYREQQSARKLLVKKGLMEEKYQRLDHKMYFRLDLQVLDTTWSHCFSRNDRSSDGETTDRQMDETTDRQFDPIYIEYTSTTTSPSPTEKIMAVKKSIIDTYNEFAARREGWAKCSKMPAGETGRLLEARAADPEWVDAFPKQMELAIAINWMKKGCLTTMIRPDNQRKILDGEWSSDSFSKEEEKPQEELDLSKPWNRPVEKSA